MAPLLALFMASLGNLSLWVDVAEQAGPSAWSILPALVLALAWMLHAGLQLCAWPWVFKPLAVVLLVLTGLVSYFVSAFGVHVDDSMLVNVFETDAREATELLTWPLVWHVCLLGLAPTWWLLRTRLSYGPPGRQLLARAGLLGLHLGVVLLAYALGGGAPSLFLREHRDLRWKVAPTAPIMAAVRLLKSSWGEPFVGPPRPLGKDAVQAPPAPGERARRLVVLVLGETARAAHFSLNGYDRETNPELALRDVISFGEVHSCGTSTAESVPCMFSALAREDFSRAAARAQENVLDVLQHAGVEVEWRENNSGCKGVCDRVRSVEASDLTDDPALVAPDGVYDEALLAGLDEALSAGRGDMLVVLHQQGSHGPAYARRTPPAFKRFLPECTRADVQNCARDELVNAYDNTILYTDHVLAMLIDLLAARAAVDSVAMLYVSDHGESLGEGGIYLHGFPYWLAPDEQTHVPMLLWTGPDGAGLDRDLLRASSGQPLSHDNLFHSLLGLFAVQTEVYDPALDAFLPARR